MKNELAVSFEGDHIKVIANGEKDLEFSTRLWEAVQKQCVQNSCYRVLGIAHTVSPVSTTEGYEHAGLFRQLGIDRKYRIAWVELNPEALDTVLFIETVLFNRGYSARAFSTISEAREWLLEPAKG